MTYEILDDTDPRLVYTGDWKQLQGPLDPKNPEYNGTIHATNDPTATVSYYNFHGKVLDILGSISAVDGAPNAIFSITPNAFSPRHLNQTGYVPTISEGVASHLWLFKSGSFTEGRYNMTLTVDGVSPGGPTFYFDFLRVQVATGVSVEKAIMDDTDQNWLFDDAAAWATVNQTGDYLYSTHQTPDAGGTSEIAFYGSEVTLYGGLSGTYDTQREIASFKVDDGPYQRIFASNVTDETAALTGVRNHKIFSTTGVQDTNGTPHTLTISVPPSTGTAAATPLPQTSPWFIDYIVFGPSMAAGASTIGTQLHSSSSSASPDAILPSASPTAALSSPSPALYPTAMLVMVILGVTIGVSIILALLIWWRRHRRSMAAARLRAFPWTTKRVPSYLLPGNDMRQPKHQKEASGNRAEQGAETGPPALRGGALGAGRRKPFGNIGRTRREPVDGSVHTMTQTGAVDTVLDIESIQPETIIREVDGGVQLIPGSSGYDEAEAMKARVLPPSYSQHRQ